MNAATTEKPRAAHGLAGIRDQHIPVRLLRNVLERRRIPSGLLFWGPGGVGKRLAALEFAKALNCLNLKTDACGECLSCRKIAHGNHPDLHTLAPVKKSRNIDVEAIDGIIEAASLRPYEGRWRVFIIQDAERMREPAQNHLLKTLEEPVGKSVFILVTEHPQWLLPTIRSRCQRVRFGALRPETVVEILQREREVSPEEAGAVAALSGGQMDRAFDLLDTDKRTVVFDVITRLAEGEDPLAIAEEFSSYLATLKTQIASSVGDTEQPDKAELSRDDRERIKEEQAALVEALSRRDTMEHLYLMETWYRDVLVYSATGSVENVLNRDRQALLDTADAARCAEKFAAIEKARLYLERFLSEERVFRDLFFALAQ